MRKGQALISLIFISVIGITIATGAVMLVLINSQSTLDLQQSTLVFEVAQSGAEKALLKLLRDPDYTGETMVVDGGTAEITRSGSGTLADKFLIVSAGRIGKYVRKIQVYAHYDAEYKLVVDSRKEIF